MHQKLFIAAFCFLCLLSASNSYLSPATPQRTDGVFPDFDNDGFGDFPVGVPNESYSGAKSEGGFHVFYGAAGGFNTNRNQFFRGKNFLNVNASLSLIGSSLAAGDADDDGFDELFVGMRGFNGNRGGIGVFWGGPGGLKASRFSLLDLGNDSQIDDGFGAVLYSGDLNGDRLYDLVAGMPSRDVGNFQNAGAIALFLSQGRDFSAPRIVTQNTPGIKGAPANNGFFGVAVTGGYFFGNDIYDLAVACPNFTGAKGAQSGAVYAFEGTSDGPKFRTHRFFLGEKPFDHFGLAMTPLPVREDFDHLAVSAPFADPLRGGNLVADAGKVYTFDVQARKRKLVLSGEFTGDVIGVSLSTGVERTDPFRPFLGVGAPGFNLGSLSDVGAAYVAKYREPFNFDPFGRFQSFGYQPKNFDRAGSSVNFINFDGIRPDFAFGAPFADAANRLDSGAVDLINVKAFVDIGVLTQNSPKIKDAAQKGDQFGFRFVAGVSFRPPD